MSSLLVFASERELQSRVAEALPVDLESGEVAVVRREMPVGRCIPDVLLVRTQDALPPSLWPRNWSYRHACVVSALRRRTTLQVSTLARLINERETEVASIVSDLEKSGALARSLTGAVHLTPAFRNLRTHITAVEAKLERWQDALEQAVGYGLFADKVVVAMDAGAGRLLTPAVIAKFRRQGVALCTIDRDRVTYLNKGRATRAASGKREYVSASLFLARTQTLWMRRYI